MTRATSLRVVALSVACLLCTLASSSDNKITNNDREFARSALKVLQDDIVHHYYDTKYHGIDLNAVFKQADQRILTADSINQALSEVAAALSSLNDSHTFFLSPPRPYVHDYGWKMKFIGDRGAFITAVRPDSDAAKKGIKSGDQVLMMNGYEVKRDYFWKMEYVYWTLRPQPALKLALRSPDGSTHEVIPEAYFRTTQKVADLTGNGIWDLIREGEREEYEQRVRYQELGKDVLIVSIPSFEFSVDEGHTILNKIHSHKAVVIDLRSNPGGIAETLEHFVGGFFDHDVKIADRIGRKQLKPAIAKGDKSHAYSGQVVVLVDSKSASAAELFARVMQLEHRGTVIGDLSSGSVMEALEYDHQSGTDNVVFYGASVTEADLIMTDGKSLEHVGVKPDTVMLPTAEDMAANRDPVLSYAVSQVGGQLSPEEAGKLFPLEWRKH